MLGAGVVGATTLAACSTSTPSTPARAVTATYRSRPDLKPTLIDVTRGSGTPGVGFICVTPTGPMLVDDTGRPLWVQPVPHASTNLRVQNFKGQRVLTWWQGEIAPYGVGLHGSYVMVDESYRQVMTVEARNGLSADLHEFLITGDGIAYFTAYRTYSADLRPVGGPMEGTALDATIQGVDLFSGELVFDWHSADHIDFSESYATYSKTAPFDPVHVNSVDTTADNQLLVSARNTWTVYKIDPVTGDIAWRLGGKKSDFSLGPGVRFAWQHDARSHPDGTVSLFDDEGDPPEGPQSRGLVLDVNETALTATLARQFPHPGRRLLAGSQGSVQLLPGGDALVGWGAEPYYTEFQADGTMVLDAKFATGSSYRAFRFGWTGTPSDRPAVAVGTPGGRRTLFVSWNGSTETAAWRLLAGPTPESLRAVDIVTRDGFETALRVPRNARQAAAQALDAVGAVLAQSATVVV